MKRYVLYVLGVVPGLVQAHYDAPWRGSLYLVLFLVFLNATIMSEFWLAGYRMKMMFQILSGFCTLATWFCSYRDMLYIIAGESKVKSAETDNHESSYNEK